MARPQFAGVDVLAGYGAEFEGREAAGLLIQGPILVLGMEPKNIPFELAKDIESARLVSAGRDLFGFGGILGGVLIGLIGWALRDSPAMQGEMVLQPRGRSQITLRGEPQHIKLMLIALEKVGVAVTR